MKNAKKLFLLGISLMLICGCGTIPKAKDGEEAIVTFEKDKTKHSISVNDLYKTLKDKYGFEEVLTMIDSYIFDTEFDAYKETANKYAQSYLDGVMKNYKSEDEFVQALSQNTNYKSIDEYKNYIYLSYMQSHAMEEYAKSLVTDKQVENYYNNKAKENIEVYQILITPSVTDKMSDTEKNKAEDAAKKEASDIIAKINKSSNKVKEFKKIAKAQSDDSATKDKGGSLGYINEFTLGNEYDELVKAAYSLKDGEVYASVVTTELGYHVVMRTATKEKDSMDKLKDSIIEKLSQEVMASDKAFSVNAIKHYRELYNLKIVDSDLDKSYRNYMNELLKSATAETDSTSK